MSGSRPHVDVGEVERLLVHVLDLDGRLRTKMLTGAAITAFWEHGLTFAGYAAGNLGCPPSDPDLRAMPDREALRPIPWDPDAAMVMTFLTDRDGAPWPLCARSVLRGVLDGAAGEGLHPTLGMELEFVLLQDLADGVVPIDGGALRSGGCYDSRSLDVAMDFLVRGASVLAGLGVEVLATEREDSFGQFEYSLAHSDALAAADDVIVARWALARLARERGWVVTFMPKPLSGLTGSALHINLGLRRPHMDLSSSQESVLLRSMTGGILQHGEALTAFACPNVNSYRRVHPRVGSLPELTSPAYITYGLESRSSMIRIPATGRLEYRLSDASCCPHLMSAALIAAGFHGISAAIDPGEPIDADLFSPMADTIGEVDLRPVPPTLIHAAEALARDEDLAVRLTLADASTSVADGLVPHYAASRIAEHHSLCEIVPASEIERYLLRW